MSATDLDSRIAGVLSRAKASPDDVAALLAEVEAALAKTERGAGAVHALRRLDPTSTSAVIAVGAGARTFDAEFRHAASGRGAGSARREACGGGRARREGGVASAEHAAISAGVMRVPRGCCETYAARVPHEIAGRARRGGADAHRLRLGPWLDRARRARPGAWTRPSRRGMQRGLRPAARAHRRGGCCGRRSRRGSTSPRWSAGDGEARSGHCRRGAEATEIASRLEEANRLARGARRKVLAGLMGMTDTAALRAAAQRLVDVDRERRAPQRRFAQPDELEARAELRRILFETRLEADRHRARRAPRAEPGLMATTSTAAQRARARRSDEGAFQCSRAQSGVWRRRGSLRATPS